MPADIPTASTLHLLGHFRDPHAGAERGLLDLHGLLQDRVAVRLWADQAPHADFAAQGVRAIKAFGGAAPFGGTLLIGGVHVGLGVWLAHGHFERIVIRYNLAFHRRLFSVMEQVRCVTGLEPQLSFVSRGLQDAVALPGTVAPSIMRIEPLLALRRSGRLPGPVTVGRLSRDDPDKHDPADPALYRMLAAQGLRVRIMGGTCLAAQLRDVPGIELLPAGAESVADFLQSLDIFFYRTGGFYEAYGRVVVEAMAAGLPVVASGLGGYAELLEFDAGAIVSTQEAAFDAVMALALQPVRRAALGEAARAVALRRHGPEATLRQAEGLLRVLSSRPGSPSPSSETPPRH